MATDRIIVVVVVARASKAIMVTIMRTIALIITRATMINLVTLTVIIITVMVMVVVTIARIRIIIMVASEYMTINNIDMLNNFKKQ